MDFFSTLGIDIAALVAAAGALVGYGVLRQKVAALETWKVRQENADSATAAEISRLLELSATNTANIANLTANIQRLTAHCDVMHLRNGQK